MTTYVGFLRAINLGASRKFPQPAIVAATEAAGFTGVETHINTGNVRFETSLRSRERIEERLEAAYREDRGFEVPTIVLTPRELSGIVEAADRLADGFDGNVYVSLLKRQPTAAQARAFEGLGTDDERAHVVGRSVVLLLDSYQGARLTNAAVEKHLGVATNRNLTVLRAVVQKWC